MSDKQANQLVKFDHRDRVFDILGVVSSAVPWIGGPIGQVISGISTERKIRRVEEILIEFANDLKDFQSGASEEYVKSEDFEDLVEQTLRRVSEEHNEEKRKILRSFLVDAVKRPNQQYDEQLRLLKLLENVYGDQILLLKAIMAEPEDNPGTWLSPMAILQKRTNAFSKGKIEDLINQTNDLRITDLQEPKTMIRGEEAQDLRNRVTPLGKRLIGYLLEH